MMLQQFGWQSGTSLAGTEVWVLLPWLGLLGVPALGAAVWTLNRRLRAQTLATAGERQRREEMEAYERLDPSLTASMAAGLKPVETAREMAKTVCRTIAEVSVFPSAAMLLKNAEGRFYCAGSVGVDDLTIAALLAWGEQVIVEERGKAGLSGDAEMHPRPRSRSGSFEAAKAGARAIASMTVRDGVKSFTVPLGSWASFDPEASHRRLEGKEERRRSRRSIVTPLRTPGGRLVGAIAVLANDGSGGTAIRGKFLQHGKASGTDRRIGAEKMMGPIEALAVKLATAVENAAMADRLLRAEKLAGLGQLAGGIAHALNNPLTAVLGFAELIEETASDARVQRDARTIRVEAHKMRETVQSLLHFWRPATLADEPVQLASVVRDLTDQCAARLQERGIQLVVIAPLDLPPVRGSWHRLRQVIEHLLNNASQAIAQAAVTVEDSDIEHTIRVTVSHDERSLNVIVSDTGPGFREPGRVFDPFYTTQQPGEGSGLGLSICYGIVREHGGEISAFNLHPQGAAVVVELPLRRTVARETGTASSSVSGSHVLTQDQASAQGA